MAIKTVRLVPVQDISPLWTPTPDDGSAHYTKIDEGVANADGDATKLEISTPAVLAVFRLASFPPDLKTVVSARWRAVAKATVGTNLGFGIVIDDVLLDPAPEIGYDFSTLPLNVWLAIDQPMPTFPALTDETETIDIVLVSAVTGGETVSLTAMELEITYDTSRTHFADVPEPTTEFTKISLT